MKKQKETSVPGAVKIPAPASAKPAPKYGLRGRLAEPKPEPKKQAVKRPGIPGKENLPQRPRPAAKVSVIKILEIDTQKIITIIILKSTGQYYYCRPSVARTLMACLPGLFGTPS